MEKTKKRREQALELLKQIARKKGGECLADEYVSGQTPMQFRCAQKHTWKTRAHYIKQGTWCPKCAIEKRRGKRYKVKQFFSDK